MPRKSARAAQRAASTKTVMQVKGEHLRRVTLRYSRFYPDHPPRTESALFRHTKHHLVEVLDTPCYICGTKVSREVHHFHAEWADANGIDWQRMKKLHPGFDWTTFQQPEDFIDSEYNMMVLCKKHHVMDGHGIHMMPYPDWIAQLTKREDEIFSPDEVTTNEPATVS